MMSLTNDSIKDFYTNDSYAYDTEEYNYSFYSNVSSDDCSRFAPESKYYQSMVYIMYTTIFIVAISGNSVVCYIVQSTPRMKTVTNYFIVNLAVGDILMALFCVPFTSVSTFILQYWPFGNFMCWFVNYFQVMSVMVSAYTLVAISVDRYMAIMWPLKPRLSKKSAVVIISCVWLFAMLTALPVALTSTTTQPRDYYSRCNRFVCTEVWPVQEYFTYYSGTLMALQLMIPLGVLVFTYTRIALVVWCKRIPGEAENSRDQRIARSKRKMIKMMITVVIVFTLCWLPMNIFLVTMNWFDWPGLPYTWLVMHWLAMSHTCYNPIIYCYMNARFRVGFIQVVSNISCLRKYVLPDPHRQRSSMVGFPLTGMETTEHSLLQRVNTCSTYVSVRHKTAVVCPPCSCVVAAAAASHHHHDKANNHHHLYHAGRRSAAPNGRSPIPPLIENSYSEDVI